RPVERSSAPLLLSTVAQTRRLAEQSSALQGAGRRLPRFGIAATASPRQRRPVERSSAPLLLRTVAQTRRLAEQSSALQRAGCRLPRFGIVATASPRLLHRDNVTVTTSPRTAPRRAELCSAALA